MVTLKRRYPLHQVNTAILQAVSKKAHEDGFLSDNDKNTAWPLGAICLRDMKMPSKSGKPYRPSGMAITALQYRRLTSSPAY